MALEFLDASYKAHHPDLRGPALTILRYLCKEIPQAQQSWYLETGQGYVDRRYCVLQFYNQCSRKTVHNAINILIALKLIKVLKKDNQTYRFYIHLKNLQRLRMTYKMWEAALPDLSPKVRVSTKEMIAEEENEWQEEARQEEVMDGDAGEPIPVADTAADEGYEQDEERRRKRYPRVG
jgi:hypothetical protein